MRTDVTTIIAITGLLGLCAFFAWIVTQHGLLFYREATGARKLSTLAGAAAVIAIIVNILVGTFTEPLPALTRPPDKSPAATPPADKASTDKSLPAHDGLRESLPAQP